MSKEIELPPAAFSNRINELDIPIDWKNWRASNEWKLFVAGYNEAAKVANASIMAKYNMGENLERIFGKK